MIFALDDEEDDRGSLSPVAAMLRVLLLSKSVSTAAAGDFTVPRIGREVEEVLFVGGVSGGLRVDVDVEVVTTEDTEPLPLEYLERFVPIQDVWMEGRERFGERRQDGEGGLREVGEDVSRGRLGEGAFPSSAMEVRVGRKCRVRTVVVSFRGRRMSE